MKKITLSIIMRLISAWTTNASEVQRESLPCFMNQMKIKFMSMFLSLFCYAAMADEPKTQLVIWEKDGTKTVYPLICKPKISFSETELIVKSNGLESIFSIDNTDSFTYENSDDNKCTIVLNQPVITFCYPLDLDFSSENRVKAYVASSYNSDTGVLNMTQVTNVKAGTGLLLVGKVGKYEISFSNNVNNYDNLLKGVTVSTKIDPIVGDHTNYMLDTEEFDHYIKGDANGDKSVNETDVETLVNIIMGKSSEKFNEIAADVNHDNIINMVDIVDVVGIIHGNSIIKTEFYHPSESSLLMARKAYLHLPTSEAQNRKGIIINFNDNISKTKSSSKNVYN